VIYGGDEDLFEDLVDMDMEWVKGNKKARGSKLKGYETSRPSICDDEESEDEELDLTYLDGEGESRLRFKSWTKEDIKNPQFFVGQVFASVVDVRKAIAEYSVKNRVEIKLPRNDNRRLRDHCDEGCPWNLYLLRTLGLIHL
jgi:hypothetical protein